MVFTGKNDNKVIQTDEQIGAFGGEVRRPTPSTFGMTAQIFGKNGKEADIILVLSKSEFQDMKVFASVYLVKDANGKLMKENGKYPLVCSFEGFIKRSMPKKDGMVAQIFAQNGKDADEVSKLCQSDLQDALVFVDIRGALAVNKVDIIEKENIKEIDAEYASELSKAQRDELNKKQKRFKKMNELLGFNFLNRMEVLSSLGSPEEFKMWISEHELCCFRLDTDRCLNEATPIQVPYLTKNYNFIPICDEHMSFFKNDEHIEKYKAYYEARHTLMMKTWAFNILKRDFSYDGKSEPDPSRIIEWASKNNLSRYLPPKYEIIL